MSGTASCNDQLLHRAAARCVAARACPDGAAQHSKNMNSASSCLALHPPLFRPEPKGFELLLLFVLFGEGATAPFRLPERGGLYGGDDPATRAASGSAGDGGAPQRRFRTYRELPVHTSWREGQRPVMVGTDGSSPETADLMHKGPHSGRMKRGDKQW